MHLKAFYHLQKAIEEVKAFARGVAPEIMENGKTGFLVQNLDEMVQSLEGIDKID